jgi:DNA-directed RNA polymerase subunit RPC12/RpoP
MFVCVSCGREVADLTLGVRCPYCGSKVLGKQTPPVAKKVSTD